MTDHTHDDLFGSSSEPELSAHDLRVRYLNSLLRKENKELKEHVERLRTLLSDVPEFQKEKLELLEGLHHACAREQAAKESLKEEEVENKCLRDALADLKFILKSVKRRKLRLNHLKRAVHVARRCVEDQQYALAMKDKIIARKDAEIKELLVLHEDCALHVNDTASRLREAQKAVLQMESLCMHKLEEASDVKRETTPITPITPPAPVKKVHSDVKKSRVRDIIIIAGSFVFLFVISLAFSDEEGVDCSCADHILDSVKEFIMSFSAVHCTELLLD